MVPEARTDLVVLVADGQIEAAIRTLLSRPEALGVTQVSHEVFRHPEHDPGCFGKSDAFLRPFVNQYRHALVVFDRHGCGWESVSREQLETHVEDRLARAGWRGRARAVVLDPELETWVWSDSPHVDDALGWQGREPPLREWLRQSGLLRDPNAKPEGPKAAFQAALREVRKPRSSAIFVQLARTVSLERCTDEAFLKLKHVLRQWFPRQSGQARKGKDR